MIDISKFEFREIDPVGFDKSRYKEFHNMLFPGGNITDNWIDWYLSSIGDIQYSGSKTRTYAAFDSETLIGIWSVEPRLLLVNSKKILKVGRCFSTGIHPDYRRMGLFVELSKRAIKFEKDYGEYEFILGFPQRGRSVIGGHIKAGWNHVKDFSIYSYNLANFTNEAYCKSDVNVSNNFKDFKIKKSVVGDFIHDSLYFCTRYEKHPHLTYITMKLNESFIIIKRYSDFVHILDIIGESEDLNILIQASLSHSKRHGVSEINVWSPNSETNLLLEKNGFFNESKYALPVQLIAVDINSNHKNVGCDFNFHMGVEEGY